MTIEKVGDIREKPNRVWGGVVSLHRVASICRRRRKETLFSRPLASANDQSLLTSSPTPMNRAAGLENSFFTCRAPPVLSVLF